MGGRIHTLVFAIGWGMGVSSWAGTAMVTPEEKAQADRLEKKWEAQYLKTEDPKEITRLNQAVEQHLPRLGEDGKFSDLAYGPSITGRDGGPGWGEHLIRVTDLFTAWRLPGTRVSGEIGFVRKLTVALDLYLAAPFDRKNIWGFGHPYSDLLENNRIGRICLFMRSAPDLFPQEEVEKRAQKILARAVHSIFLPSEDPQKRFRHVRPGWEGGANLLWATRGELVPYLVSSDEKLRREAIDAYLGHVWNSQTVTWPKGPLGQIERLTVDGMLGEHGAPAMGSYGEWYLNAVVEYGEVVRGAEPWDMPPHLRAFWIDHLLDSMAFVYQGAVDPHLGNPLVWMNARKTGNAKLKEWLRAFSRESDHRQGEVAAMLAWEPGQTPWPKTGRSVRHYYTADFMTKHFPKFMASTRAVSERTFGMETFSQKEPKNRWALEAVMLPLGTTFLRRDTREFQSLQNGSVFTAMDFSRLPGQTTRQVSSAALASAWNRDEEGFAVRMVLGGTPFAGGVEAEHTGVMAWWQSRYVQVDRDRPGQHRMTDLSVNGRRAVFYLEDAVVHLGAGFDVRHPKESTLTNLEQRASGAETTRYALLQGDPQTLRRGETVRNEGVAWAWHEGVGYFPPRDGEKVLRDVLQVGEPNRQVFSFWSDHGNKKNSLSFLWSVRPDVRLEEMPALLREPGWKVVRNDVRIQSLAVPSRGWWGAVFHEPGNWEDGSLALQVDRPCLLILEKKEGKMWVRYSDPLQQGGSLILTLNGKAHAMPFAEYPHLGMSRSREISD